MKRAIHDEETDDFLGYVTKDNTSWQAQTIFGYIIARTETEQDAKKVLHTQGLNYLKGTWQYYDTDDDEWSPCVIKQAYEHKVTVARTNLLGYEDPNRFKMVIIDNPDENKLIKSN